MPNWCSTEYAFYAKGEKGKEDLEKFYVMLDTILEEGYDSGVEQDFGNGWLGNVLAKAFEGVELPVNETTKNVIYPSVNGETIRYRGSIIDINEINQEDEDTADYFFCSVETAWAEMPEMWDCIFKQLNYDIQYVYVAEECGMGYFKNTDINGDYFLDTWNIDLSLDIDKDVLYTVATSNIEALEFLNDVINKLRELYQREGSAEKYKLSECELAKEGNIFELLVEQDEVEKARDVLQKATQHIDGWWVNINKYEH